MKDQHLSRRKFLGTAVLAAAGIALTSKSGFGMPAYIKNLGKPNSMFNGVQVGAITYSWRSLPDDAESVLKYAVNCNISAIELMGNTAESFAGLPASPRTNGPWVKPADRTPEQKAAFAEAAKKAADWRASVSMDKFETLRKMYKDAGVMIYAYKPNALSVNNTDAEIDYALRAAKALGASHVTVEMPEDPAQTQRLGKMAAKHGVYVAYHGHEQQTPTFWDQSMQQSDYNAMNLDMGHYTAAGYDALAEIKKYHQHIKSMHVKDRQNKAHGGANLPWGEGDTPIIQALQLMQKNKYTFPATIELEYKIPEGSDAVKETIKCVEYARKALNA
ncbi:sugar phosphate isomerase/epimerase family protein [Rubrolithibacter danxiaensis]|uniref:sugar phosphate isomerase/epimerase family protein n=1 Tax=Rubrolithibacter danxiaensis TaxID=3390805 RepID=UPI003BF8CEEE